MTDEEKMLDIIYSYRKAQLIHVAAKLGISDILKDSIKSSDEIARLTGTDPDALYRVMRALSGIGIYREKEDRHFEMAPMGELLKKDDPGSVRINALMSYPK